MTRDIVIRAEGLGKKYVIGHQTERERYTTLRDVLARSGRNLARAAADTLRGRSIVAGDTIEEFWALKDVSFEVKRGEVLGIIGRNGAGKSTLLKILSRITEPSQGRVEIKGRVASLLEVGTGFHPELTGRENIFLNGAILGMTRAEIMRKFDEIVDFSGVEKFLDTPVKRYSSGMYVRLAFAVAAHLEPEILVVDEVLAVGDTEFQKKCLGKMQDVAGHGRTVLFVSHNVGAIQNLCARAVLLGSGRLILDGTTRQAIERLINASSDQLLTHWRRSQTSRKSRIAEVRLMTDESEVTLSPWSDPVAIEIDYTISSERGAEIGIEVVDESGKLIFFSSEPIVGDDAVEDFTAKVVVPARLLAPRRYYISVILHIPNNKIIDRCNDVIVVDVVADDQSLYKYGSTEDMGVVTVNLEWKISRKSTIQ
jgi:ABC-type polysaccharide/polyol phosphate transport system ATPase subunit